MNIAEILKNAPIGLELYSPYCGWCNFYGIDNEGKSITVKACEKFITFSSEGKINDSGECLLFPYKKHDWVGWQKYLFHQGDIIDDGKGIFIICKSSICCVDSSNNIRSVDFNESNYASKKEAEKFLEEVRSGGYKFDYSSGGLIPIEDEDENVREEIIDFIYDKADTEELREKSNKWLEWLEKQKEATCVSEIIDRLTPKEQKILFKELEMQKPTELGENRSRELSLSLQIQAYLNTASDELYAKGKPLYSEERIEDIHKCMLMWQKLHNTYFYQKPSWSEEDEKIINDLLWIVEAYRKNGFNEVHKSIADKSENWLKSIKDRVQPQQDQEWSEEDECLLLAQFPQR